MLLSRFCYASSRKGKILIVRVEGSLDAKAAPVFQKRLRKEIGGGAQNVVINLSGIDYIASAGMGVLIEFNQQVGESGGRVKLSAISDKVKKIFRLLGFERLFEIYSNDREAIGSF